MSGKSLPIGALAPYHTLQIDWCHMIYLSLMIDILSPEHERENIIVEKKTCIIGTQQDRPIFTSNQIRYCTWQKRISMWSVFNVLFLVYSKLSFSTMCKVTIDWQDTKIKHIYLRICNGLALLFHGDTNTYQDVWRKTIFGGNSACRYTNSLKSTKVISAEINTG